MAVSCKMAGSMWFGNQHTNHCSNIAKTNVLASKDPLILELLKNRAYV